MVRQTNLILGCPSTQVKQRLKFKAFMGIGTAPTKWWSMALIENARGSTRCQRCCFRRERSNEGHSAYEYIEMSRCIINQDNHIQAEHKDKARTYFKRRMKYNRLPRRKAQFKLELLPRASFESVRLFYHEERGTN